MTLSFLKLVKKFNLRLKYKSSFILICLQNVLMSLTLCMTTPTPELGSEPCRLQILQQASLQILNECIRRPNYNAFNPECECARSGYSSDRSLGPNYSACCWKIETCVYSTSKWEQFCFKVQQNWSYNTSPRYHQANILAYVLSVHLQTD